VGFGWEGLEHLCSCHCIGCIGLSSRRFVEVKSLWACYSWVLGTLEGLVASGLLGDLQLSCGDLPKLSGVLVVILGSLQLSCGLCLKICEFLGNFQLSCGDCPRLVWAQWLPSRVMQAIVNWDILDGSSILVRRLEENMVSLHGVWRALCLHTAPTESVNFGTHRCLCVPQLFLYLSSFTYAIYFVIAFVLEVIYQSSHSSISHWCT
jgi:hypothetical protein